MILTFLIGAVCVAVLVRLLLAAMPDGMGLVKSWRLPAHMLLLGVPALLVPTDVMAIAALASCSTAVFELLLILL